MTFFKTASLTWIDISDYKSEAWFQWRHTLGMGIVSVVAELPISSIMFLMRTDRVATSRSTDSRVSQLESESGGCDSMERYLPTVISTLSELIRVIDDILRA